MGYIGMMGYMWELYRDNEKEHGNYNLRLGVESLGVCPPTLWNQLERKMENEMEPGTM